jgi:NitT/TauT family transport system substrate-binding protein
MHNTIFTLQNAARLFLLFGFFAANAHAATKTRLALNWKPEPEFGGFYAAEAIGAYEKQGLSVAILPGGSGTPVVQMIAAGQADFGIVSADEIVIARSHGAAVVALFAVYQINPQGLMTHSDPTLATMGDLWKSGGTLAVQKGLPYWLFLNKKFGEPKPKVVPYPGGIANFLSDKNYSQQCFVTSEPLEAKKKNIKTRVFLVADAGYNPYTAVVAVRGELLRKNPKLAKDMVVAVRAGWREYLDRPEVANKRMAGLNKAMDLATFSESAEAQKPLIETTQTMKNGLGKMTEARWKELTQQLLELKVIDKAPDAKAMFVDL